MLVRVLGPLESLTYDDQPIRFNGNKQRLLLAALVLHAGRWISNQQLAELLWEEQPPESAPANLKTYIWELRRALPPPADGGQRIQSRHGDYRLVTDRTEVDLLVFEDLLSAGQAARDAGNLLTAQQKLTEAIRLWRGEPLAKLALPAAMANQQLRLTELRCTALEQLYDVGLALGQHVSLVTDIKQTLDQHPLREGLWGQLMIALYRCGRRAEALETFLELRGRLAAELGIDPGPDLKRLHSLILKDDPQLQSPIPALAPSPTPSIEPPAYLPPDLASFTGREDEIRSVVDLVEAQAQQQPVRVLISSIDGMAGVGKTMLAVHLGHCLAAEFPDGQLFVDLRGFTPDSEPMDAEAALDQLLHQLGIPTDAIPASPEDRAALYRRRLAGTRTLILLDNAATEDQIRPLLSGADGCLVLITSRRRMTEIDDMFPVSLDILPMAEAASLFCDAAGINAAEQDSDLVDEVVRLCGRLPLALRICGVRLRARPNWGLSHLADRLRRGYGRLAELKAGQRSVEAAIQVSYQQLSEAEQWMFRLLGLHIGADVDTYSAAALTGLADLETDRLLEALVDANLLNSDVPGRYRMHDLVRQHASRLVEHEDTAQDRQVAKTRLLDYWLDIAATAATVVLPLQPALTPRLTFPPKYKPELSTAAEYVEWFELERTNLVLAISFSQRHGLDEHTWQLAYTIGGLFHLRGHIDDWMTTQEQALNASAHLGNCAERAEMRKNAGMAQWMLGNSEQTLRCYREALAMLRDIDDKVGEVHQLILLGLVHWRLGQYPEALSCEAQARPVITELGDQDCWLRAVQLLALTYWHIGRYADMADLLHQSLALARTRNSPLNESDSLNALGLANLRLGNHAEALADQHQAMAIHRKRGDRWGQLHTHNIIGLLQIRLGRPDDAVTHQQSAIALSQYLSDRWGEAQSLNILGMASVALGKPIDAMTYWEKSLAIVRRIGDPGLECDVLNGLGTAHDLLGKPEKAIALYRRAAEIAAEIGEPFQQARAHRCLAAALDSAESGAEFHRAQADRIYAELGIPEHSR